MEGCEGCFGSFASIQEDSERRLLAHDDVYSF